MIAKLNLFCAAVMVFSDSCSTGQLGNVQYANVNASQNVPFDDQDIDKARAATIARDDASRKFGPLTNYASSECSQGYFWRVFFEARNPDSEEQLIEYVITKKGGMILSARRIAKPKNTTQNSNAGSGIKRSDAIQIVRRELGAKKVDEERLTVCELESAWRVLYAPKKGWVGGSSEYLIDKQNGQILESRRYQ